MLKENGRKEPAEKAELANLKGKHMKCPKCGEYAVMANVKFADTKCGTCGTQMVDTSMEQANKAKGN